MAVDLQGADRARPFHEKAGAEFTTVVDADNHLAGIFGFRAIPNGILIDEQGVLRYTRFGGFDIRKPECAAVIERFVATGEVVADETVAAATTAPGVTTLDHFHRGLALYRAGDLEGAAAIWREGVVLEPDHWNMRKQLWALENPDRFYDGDVDYAWQKEQIEAGR